MDQPEELRERPGETHSIRKLVERAFEVGIDDWGGYVRQDPKFMLHAEVDLLIGDASKAPGRARLVPDVDFGALVKMMVTNDPTVEADKGPGRPARMPVHVVRRLIRRLMLAFRTAASPLLKGSRVARWRWTSALYERAMNAGFGGAAFQDVVFRGATIRIPSREISILPGLVSGDYEQTELDAFERLCVPGCVVVDVGANIGIYSVLAARKGDTRVFAVEPVPENIALLKHNLSANGFPERVAVIEAAAGEASGDLSMYLSEGSVGTHSADPAVGGAQCIVRIVRLDDELANHGVEHVDVVKIDVEGYELHALKGMIKILERDRPTVLIEINGERLRGCGTDPGALVDFLWRLYPVRYVARHGSLDQLHDRSMLLRRDAFENMIFSAAPLPIS